MSSGKKKKRLDDFEAHASSDLSCLFTCRAGRYVAINPTSDERELLRKLNLAPESCLKCDCYWNTGEDVHFVQVMTSTYAPDMASGLYARVWNGRGYDLNLVVVVRVAVISRAVVESSLARALTVLERKRPLRRTLELLEGDA